MDPPPENKKLAGFLKVTLRGLEQDFAWILSGLLNWNQHGTHPGSFFLIVVVILELVCDWLVALRIAFEDVLGCVWILGRLSEAVWIETPVDWSLSFQDLGSFGPLKCRERRALSQLQVQGRILNKLAKLIEKWQRDPSVKLSIIEELNGLPHLQVNPALLLPGPT